MSERTTEMERVASWDNDPATRGKVIDSIVLRGDLSGLGPGERARFYIQMCEGLGLNPASQPFAFLRLNGKEILYATRGATDQLAAMHRVTREIIDGPKVIDLAGTKMVYAVCKASMPNGRFETATATVPLIDPVNVLMKAETKAKRRATLSLLGLGVLDELEIETIPAGAQSPGGGVDLARATDPVDATVEALGHPLDAFHAALPALTGSDAGVALWAEHRAALNAAQEDERKDAWAELVKRVVELSGTKPAAVKVWLKGQLAARDAAAAKKMQEPAQQTERTREPGDDDDQPDPPAGGSGGSSNGRSSSAKGSAVAQATASGPVGLVEPWMDSEEGITGYLAQRGHWNAVENAVRKHDAVVPAHLRPTFRLKAAWRTQTLSLDAMGSVLPLDGAHGCKALVAKWAAEGPVGRASAQRKAA